MTEKMKTREERLREIKIDAESRIYTGGDVPFLLEELVRAQERGAGVAFVEGFADLPLADQRATLIALAEKHVERLDTEIKLIYAERHDLAKKSYGRAATVFDVTDLFDMEDRIDKLKIQHLRWDEIARKARRWG